MVESLILSTASYYFGASGAPEVMIGSMYLSSGVKDSWYDWLEDENIKHDLMFG